MKTSKLWIEPIRKRFKNGKVSVLASHDSAKRKSQYAREKMFQEKINKLCKKYPDLPMFLMHNLKVTLLDPAPWCIETAKREYFIFSHNYFIGKP